MWPRLPSTSFGREAAQYVIRCGKATNSTSFFEGQKMLLWARRALILNIIPEQKAQKLQLVLFRVLSFEHLGFD